MKGVKIQRIQVLSNQYVLAIICRWLAQFYSIFVKHKNSLTNHENNFIFMSLSCDSGMIVNCYL